MADFVLNEDSTEYISPNELARRWQVHRTTVDAIARRNSFTAFYLGDGSRGAVRFKREEVLAYEKSRQVTLSK